MFLLLFQFQKGLLCRKSSGIAGQAAVVTQDPVAGDEDPDGIAAAGLAHGTAGSGISDGCGDLPVAACFAVRDGLEGLPDGCLKGRSGGAER